MENEYGNHRGSRIKDQNLNPEAQKVKNRGNFILRQELKNLTPYCNIKCSIIFNGLIFLFFMISSIIILSSTSKYSDYSIEYTNW